MGSSHWLLSFLTEHINASKPDGRPLYAYKCRNEAYDQLSDLMREMFPKAKGGDPPLNFTPLLCLFAAETWRRMHAGGPWKWDTVFNEINKKTPKYPQIHEWVQNGLSFWKRPILQSSTNKRLYLVTIACEGGLPLLLLRNENASLSRYFKQLLQTYHHEKQLPDCDITAIARRLASYLPQSLRYKIVYNLGAKLVEQIVNLQYKVAEAVDPIVALDKDYPNWRDSLPLPLRDSTVELFLKNLVNEAKTLTLSERQRIIWRRLLKKHGDEWHIEQGLELPNQFSGAVLRKWLNRENLVPRMRILLQTMQEIFPVALLTRLRGEGDEAIYRCEVLKRKGIQLSGPQALAGVRLLVSDGECESDLEVNGGEAWGPLPWIFRERNGQWEYLREGSTRCREDQIRILAPSNGILKATEGECLLIGSLPELGRDLWQFNGTVLWMHPELGNCRIVCSSQDATEEALSLVGRRFYIQTDSTPIFSGLPSVYATAQDGGRRLLNLPMQWRPYTGGGLTWSDEPEACLGDVWLRYLDTDGTQVLRRRVRIVPETFRVEIDRLGIDQEIGKLRLSGLSDCKVNCVERDDCEFEVEPAGSVTFIHCLSEIGLPVTTFKTRLHWTGGKSLEVSLPFPQLGAAFDFAGNVLPDGEWVPVTRLAAVQAVAQAPLRRQTFDLNVTINSKVYALNQMWLREPFEVGDDGRGIFYLHRLQERIASLLALTGELDACAMVKILKPGDQCLAHLRVGQFDMILTPDKENHLVLLMENCLKRLENGWEDRISIRMVPLWAPDREPIVLNKVADQAAWKLPDNLEPGPWWVLGEDGDWPRFRPLLWSQTGEIHSDSPLEKVIRQGDPEARKQMYLNWAEQISMDPNHPDWATFFNLLQLVRPYPASALDLFSSVINCHETMVMALLCSGEESFETVWSLSSQLPFSWYLLPVNAWRNAATRYFGSIKVALADIKNGEDLVWEEFRKIQDRVTSQRPFFHQICDWLSHSIFPEKPLHNSELTLARNHPDVIESLIAQEELNLQGRHDPEEQYPEGPQIMRWTDRLGFPQQFKYKRLAKPFRPVRCAPFVAAHVSLEGQPYDEKLLFELKLTRDFDREWFNSAYAYALCLGLSKTMTY